MGIRKSKLKRTICSEREARAQARPIGDICRTWECDRSLGILIREPDLRRRTGNGIGTLAEHTDGVSSRSLVFLDTGDLPRQMTDNKFDVAPEASSVRPEEIHSHLRHLDRRQWWLWSTTVAVTLLLTLAVASFAFPAMLSREEGTYSFYLNQSVRALVGMVLIFSVYVIYQQVLIYRMRNQISRADSIPCKSREPRIGSLQTRSSRPAYGALQSAFRRTAARAGNQPRPAPWPPADRAAARPE